MSSVETTVSQGETRLRKTRIGRVISNKMSKTVVVEVLSKGPHAVFKKYVTKRVSLMAHDEKGECGIGDKVMITETRPLSKNKRWKVSQILDRAADLKEEIL